MAGGTYAALSGLRTRMEQLDRLASDIANAKTAGYKAERVTTNAAERPDFGKALQAAVDVTPGPGHLDFRPGSLEKTGRDLDFAIEGRGFFVVDTPQGPRYTRNGNFSLAADGTVTTADGYAVQTTNGPLKVGRNGGAISVAEDGTVTVGALTAGKLRVVDFGDYTELQREDLGRFRAPATATPDDATGATVRAGLLEASNVSVVDRMVALTEVARGFEALQRGLNILSTELDGRAITELGNAERRTRNGERRTTSAGHATGRARCPSVADDPQDRPERGEPVIDRSRTNMIRAMYTAASGMNAQQANIDNIAHNLANVNTSGFKKSRVEFEDLVYQQVTAPGTPTDATAESPVGIELGLGAKPVAISRDFASGNLRATNAPYDVAIEGRGFLQVTLPDGQLAYTRSGNLHVNQEGTLVTNEGYVLEPSITIPPNAVSVTIAKDGVVSATVAGESAPQQVGTIQIAAFQNPAGLHAMGSNLFTVTTASGDAITGLPGTDGLGTLQQGFLEESNVSIVEEMVNMILGQRAYEANSKVIRTADEMLSQVNNLAR